jgi:hypothetical protein
MTMPSSTRIAADISRARRSRCHQSNQAPHPRPADPGSTGQSDALAAYRRVRDLLAGKLGIDPGESLRRLHAAVLAQDPALDWHGPYRGHPVFVPAA